MAAEEVNCACTGIRRCLLCEDNVRSQNAPRNAVEEKSTTKLRRYKLCIVSGKTMTLSSPKQCTHIQNSNNAVDSENETNLEGVSVILDFVSESEELSIVKEIDRTVWKSSQSGRRKQVREEEIFNPQLSLILLLLLFLLLLSLLFFYNHHYYYYYYYYYHYYFFTIIIIIGNIEQFSKFNGYQ